jgi:hypothetical protein
MTKQPATHQAATRGHLPLHHPKRIASPDTKRPKLPHRDMDALVRMAWEQGWWCVRAHTNHVKCWPPNDTRMIPIPSTPSGSNTYANKLAALKRGGLRA